MRQAVAVVQAGLVATIQTYTTQVQWPRTHYATLFARHFFKQQKNWQNLIISLRTFKWSQILINSNKYFILFLQKAKELTCMAKVHGF